MHIVFFSDNYAPESNPSANRVSERARYWAQAGHKVTVLASYPNFPEGRPYKGYKNRFFGSKEVIDGVTVLRCWSFMAPNKGVFLRTIDFLSFMFSSTIRCLFSVDKPDVIVVTSPQFFQAVGASLAAWLKRVPFVIEISDLWPDAVHELGVVSQRWLLKPFFWLEMAMYRHASGIILLTSAYKENLVSRGVDPRKIAVIRNGADLRMVGAVATDKELKRKLGLESKFVAGYIGTLGIAQNLTNAVLAYEELARRGDTKNALLIIGGGSDKQKLRAMIAASPQNPNIKILDAIPRSEVEKYTSVTDISLIHLRNSGSNKTVIPSKVFEAMGAGKPVLLVAPRGEAQKIVEYRDVGIFVEPDNPAKLADEIQRLSKAKPELERYKKNGIKNAKLHSRQLQAEYYVSALEIAVEREHAEMLKTERNKSSKSKFEMASDPITGEIEKMNQVEKAAG